MANWIPRQGIYVVKPSGPINEEENTKHLEVVKQKLEEAERRFACELLLINIIKTSEN
ncbi:hypothetical protein [Psychrobacillus soli]|uniref:hypothetical protein n=1 Tax=Psychrobacillus soli TaxID=1543965 RepID=UPI00163C8F1E|nr:hypothetical protein [Psychrobacillus soli]